MPFIDVFERKAIERATAEAFKKGFEQGLKQGLLEGIERYLEFKFGAAGLELMPEIREIGAHERLRDVLAGIGTAATPDDLCRIWTRKRRAKAAKPR